MTRTRGNRLACLAVCLSILLSVFVAWPLVANSRVDAAGSVEIVHGENDGDHTSVTVKVRGYDPGDVLTLSLEFNCGVEYTLRSGGMTEADYDPEDYVVTLKITGTNGSPNGDYTIDIAGTGIADFFATLDRLNVEKTAPPPPPPDDPTKPGKDDPVKPSKDDPPGPGKDPVNPKKTDTPTPKPEKTSTPTPAKTSTPTPAKTSTPTPAKTSTPTPAKTSTPTPAKTSTPTPAKTSTPTPAKTSTPTPAKTSTPTPAKTSTPTPAKTSTPTPSKTSATTPASTKSSTTTATPAIVETKQEKSADTDATTEKTTTTETAVSSASDTSLDPSEGSSGEEPSSSSESMEPVGELDVNETSDPSGAGLIMPNEDGDNGDGDAKDPSQAPDPDASDGNDVLLRASNKENTVSAASENNGKNYTSEIIWAIVIIILLILAYLRYRALAREDSDIVYIVTNFIPIPALISKVRKMKEDKEPTSDGPAPVVMNGYLQKPTVGTEAANAIRPIRSNVSSASTSRPGNSVKTNAATETKPQPAKDSRPGAKTKAPIEKQPVVKPQSETQPDPVTKPDPAVKPHPVLPPRMAAKLEKHSEGEGNPEVETDTSLPEMMKRQRELELEMEKLSKEMRQISDIEDAGLPPET